MQDDSRDILNYVEAPIHIDDIITSLVTQQTHLSDHIDCHWNGLDPEQLARLLSLHGQNATRLGRLLRDRYAFYGDVYERIEAMAERFAQDPEFAAAPSADGEALADGLPSDPDFHPLPIHIDDVIADLAAKQTRLAQYLDRCWQDPDAEHPDRLLAVYSQNAARLTRLLHHRAAIYGPPPDPLRVAIDQALGTLGEMWGIDLLNPG